MKVATVGLHIVKTVAVVRSYLVAAYIDTCGQSEIAVTFCAPRN